MSLPFVPSRLSKIFKWDRFKKLKDFSEDEIVLTKGATRGRFRVDTAPHLEFIMGQIDKTHVSMVVLKVASQTQKTSTLLAAIMKWIATDVHDMFIMIPRASDIKKFLEFKIKPFIEGTRVVDEMMKDYRQEEAERKHSHHYKTAKNIFSVISQNDTKSITTKYGVFDEIAEFEAGKISEAMERMKTYGVTYKTLLASTQIHENDEVNHFFNSCEVKFQQRIICPHCDGNFYPSPSNLKYPSEEDYKSKFKIQDELTFNDIMSDYLPWSSRQATLECPHCSYQIIDKVRVKQMRDKNFVWVQIVPISTDDNSGVQWHETKTPKDYYESVGIDTNTAFAMDVPLSKFAEMDITCKHAKPNEKQVRYEKYYVGWWNILYYNENRSTVKRSDILKMANGVPYKEVPLGTNALHIGIDLQKDRLYYIVIAVEFGTDIIVDIIEYDELYSDGVGNDFTQLEEILFQDYYDSNGEAYKIHSGGMDVRGFSLKDKDSRSRQALDFIFKIAHKLKEDREENWDSFLYPTLGVAELPARYETNGYRVQPRKQDIDGEEIKLNDVVFSNINIKNLAFTLMEDGIRGGKDAGVLKITDQIIDDFEHRQSLPKEERRDKHSLEAHLSSEHLTYKIVNGRPSSKMSYEKKYEGVRNDWLDCLGIALTQTLLHKTYSNEDTSVDIEDGEIENMIKDAF